MPPWKQQAMPFSTPRSTEVRFDDSCAHSRTCSDRSPPSLHSPIMCSILTCACAGHDDTLQGPFQRAELFVRAARTPAGATRAMQGGTASHHHCPPGACALPADMTAPKHQCRLAHRHRVSAQQKSAYVYGWLDMSHIHASVAQRFRASL